ncbi:HlyD family type I secretion periplasmic adaptor subunit [Steroidobacter flavus]|uniref:Membrane fusion protein (MFP) family protein n=1 Tax=Steroidobacter flavus TaxID=1842136 RepID=A0ABV8SYM2_9GAMM
MGRATRCSRRWPEERSVLAHAEPLQNARPLAHWILWSTLAFFVIALLWASQAQLDEVTLGQGQVIPSSKIQVVQNLEGGIIAEILVEPGQVVNKGQTLMRIDDTRFSSSYQEGAAKDDSLRARIARLEAEASLGEFIAPADLQSRAVELVRHERAVFDARRRDLDASLAVLERQGEQRAQELSEVQTHAAQLEHSYDLVQQELAITRQAADQSVFPKVQLIRLERQANDLKGELDVARLSVPRLQAAMAEVRRRADQATAEFRSAASRELSEARAEQSVISATKVALEDRLARTTVRAPLTGTIKQVKVNTIGGVVQPGMDLVEIVPLEDSLLVEARVRPADIAFLRPGLPAMVKLTAYDFSIYGGLEGTVDHISADAILDERSAARPESYYLVRVRTSRGGRGAGDKHLKIIPGMQATVDIRTGHKTVLQYLLKPILRARQTALRER